MIIEETRHKREGANWLRPGPTTTTNSNPYPPQGAQGFESGCVPRNKACSESVFRIPPHILPELPPSQSFPTNPSAPKPTAAP